MFKKLMIVIAIASFTASGRAQASQDLEASFAQIRDVAQQFENMVYGIRGLVKAVAKNGQAVTGVEMRKIVAKKVKDKGREVADGVKNTCRESATELDTIARDAVEGVVAAIFQQLAVTSQRVAQTAEKTASSGVSQLIRTALGIKNVGKTLSSAV